MNDNDLYGIKSVPNVLIKYMLRTGEQKEIYLSTIKEYSISVKPNEVQCIIYLPLIFNKSFLTDFKGNVIKQEVIQYILLADNEMRSAETGKDEKYIELDNVIFNSCSFDYKLDCSGVPMEMTLNFSTGYVL